MKKIKVMFKDGKSKYFFVNSYEEGNDPITRDKVVRVHYTKEKYEVLTNVEWVKLCLSNKEAK